MTAQIRIKGLDDFRRDLRRADKRMGKAFGLANEKIGRKVTDRAVPAVIGLPTPSGGRATIKASKAQKSAQIRIGGRDATKANVFGTKTHMVFGRRIPGSGPFRPWLGQNWSPEDLYGVGPVIQNAVDGFVLEDYLDAVMDGLAEAFPN